MRVGLRLQVSQARGAERRQRKPADELDDVIPLEGAEGTRMHG
jgi:hypothetical protein